MSVALIKAMLNYDFYQKYSSTLTESLFPNEFKLLFQTVAFLHSQHPGNKLKVQEVWETLKTKNPVLTTAKKQAIYEVLQEIKSEPELLPDIAENLLKSTLKQEICRQIANEALLISEESHNDFNKIQVLLNQVLEGVQLSSVKPEYVSTDIDELLDNINKNYIWKFNYTPLALALGTIGPGLFGIIAARPDAGKTAFYVNLTYGRGGWLEQGAKVHIICNEEPAVRTQARGISCNSQIPVDELKNNLEFVRKQFSSVKDNIFVQDKVGMTMNELEEYCSKTEIDILIIDQLDKMTVDGKFNRSDERLKEVYIRAREIAKRYNIAVIGVSQVSASADNNLYYGFDALEGSKTSKAAEADYILCIGKKVNSEAEGIDNGFRVINIPKNKLTGPQAPITYMLDHSTSSMRS